MAGLPIPSTPIDDLPTASLRCARVCRHFSLSGGNIITRRETNAQGQAACATRFSRAPGQTRAAAPRGDGRCIDRYEGDR